MIFYFGSYYTIFTLIQLFLPIYDIHWVGRWQVGIEPLGGLLQIFLVGDVVPLKNASGLQSLSCQPVTDNRHSFRCGFTKSFLLIPNFQLL